MRQIRAAALLVHGRIRFPRSRDARLCPYAHGVFIVTLTYLCDLDLIDESLPDHVDWLDRQYADGVFVASGRQVPRRGGVILARGLAREELDRRLALDPFGQRGLASYAITEFLPTRTAAGLELLHEDVPSA
jgi:uncharacterized protein YciI